MGTNFSVNLTSVNKRPNAFQTFVKNYIFIQVTISRIVLYTTKFTTINHKVSNVTSTRSFHYVCMRWRTIFVPIWKKKTTDLSVMHSKIIESSFEPGFDFRLNRFESILLREWTFSERFSFIWFSRLMRRRHGKLWFTCFGGRLKKRRWMFFIKRWNLLWNL
jgi:hypothetical protein